MLDLFAPASLDLRTARLKEYRDYLIEHDGDMNLSERTLSRREASMRRLETTPDSPRAMNEREFREQYARFDKRKPLSEEMLLLLSLVKVNAAEAYGVTRAYQRTLDRALKSDDETELRILCQEGYHTRILVSSARLYGMQIDQPYRPPSALRILIGGILTMPDALGRPLTLAAEIHATLMFVKLLREAKRVLAHVPEVRDAIEERVMEILVDEIGHITFNRMHLGPAGLAQARMLVPVVARSMASVFPEIVALGAYPQDPFADLPLVADRARLPECVRRTSFAA